MVGYKPLTRIVQQTSASQLNDNFDMILTGTPNGTGTITVSRTAPDATVADYTTISIGQGDGFSTTGGNSLGWLKNGDQSGVSDPNSVVQSGRGLTGNGFSGSFLQEIEIYFGKKIFGQSGVEGNIFTISRSSVYKNPCDEDSGK